MSGELVKETRKTTPIVWGWTIDSILKDGIIRRIPCYRVAPHDSYMVAPNYRQPQGRVYWSREEAWEAALATINGAREGFIRGLTQVNRIHPMFEEDPEELEVTEI